MRFPGLATNATVSVGVAMASDAGRDLSALLATADRPLYRAKADGRNRVAPAPLVLVRDAPRMGIDGPRNRGADRRLASDARSLFNVASETLLMNRSVVSLLAAVPPVADSNPVLSFSSTEKVSPLAAPLSVTLPTAMPIAG
jgi:hypothetical protein